MFRGIKLTSSYLEMFFTLRDNLLQTVLYGGHITELASVLFLFVWGFFVEGLV